MIITRRHFHKLAIGSMATMGLGLTGSHALAARVNKYAEELENGEFNWFPERSPGGPLLIIVSIPDQKVHVYRNGIRIAASTCSTGKPGHSTPTGVFKILQKDKHHRSSTYNNAPMPNMNRLTWSGIALHAGKLPGYPASHGCVRLADGILGTAFRHHQDGHDGGHRRQQVVSRRGGPSRIGTRQVCAAVNLAASTASVKKRQYSEGQIARPKSTSVVVSGKDKSISVFEDDKIVASGKITIKDQNKPLGEHVHTLKGTDAGRRNVTVVLDGLRKAGSRGHGLRTPAHRSRAEDEGRGQEAHASRHDGGDHQRVLDRCASERK